MYIVHRISIFDNCGLCSSGGRSSNGTYSYSSYGDLCGRNSSKRPATTVLAETTPSKVTAAAVGVVSAYATRRTTAITATPVANAAMAAITVPDIGVAATTPARTRKTVPDTETAAAVTEG